MQDRGKENVILISIHANSVCNAALTENLFIDTPSDCPPPSQQRRLRSLVDRHVDDIISYLGLLYPKSHPERHIRPIPLRIVG